MIRTALDHVPVTPETLDVDAIKSVGVGGEYLTHPTAFERFRALSQAGIFNRRAYPAWFQRGTNRVDIEASVKLHQRLGSYEKPLIDEGLEKELKDYVVQIIDPKSICEVSVFCRVIGIVGMLPTTSHI